MSAGCEITENDMFEICKRAYSNNNKVLKFNKYTNPRHTYTWRAIKTLAGKFNKCGLEYDQVYKIINAGLEISNNDSSFTLYRFNNLEFMTECCKRAMYHDSQDQHIVDAFVNSHKWVQHRCGHNVFNTMINKTSLHGMTNIAMWYKSNLISTYYIALSADCSKAVEHLQTSSDSNLLPSIEELGVVRRSVSKALLQRLIESLSQVS